MQSFSVEPLPSNVKLDKPAQEIVFDKQIYRVEFSPFEWSQNVLLVAFEDNVAVYSIRFQEEDETLKEAISTTLVEEFPLKGRAHSLAISQETLINSSQKVMQFACTSSNCCIYLYEYGLKDYSEIKVLKGHTDYVNDICFDKESTVDLLASVSDDRTCRIWSVKDATCSILFYLQSPGMAVKWSSDDANNNRIMVAEKLGVIRLYNIEQRQPVLSLDMDISPLRDIDWCPTNRSKVAALASGYLLVWDTLKSSYPIVKQHLYSDGGKCVRFCSQNENVISSLGYPNHTLCVTNTNSKFPSNLIKLKLSSNCTWHYRLPYLCVGVDNNICFWKIITK